MCRLQCCERVDNLTGSQYYVPKDVWTRITKYYLAHHSEWSKSPAGQVRLRRAKRWFLSHIAKREE